jgi:FG-GAP repeat
MPMRRTVNFLALLLLVALAFPAGADFNDDGVTDLAVGVPGESDFAGAITVLHGVGVTGLSGSGSQLFMQVAGAVEGGDLFGAALAAGNFNGDAFADLAVGAPAEDVSGAFDAGAVSALYGAAGGLSTAGGQLFTQNSPGVPGGAEDFDSFGGNFSAPADQWITFDASWP